MRAGKNVVQKCGKVGRGDMNLCLFLDHII